MLVERVKGRGRPCHCRRSNTGDVRPSVSTSITCSGGNQGRKPVRKCPRDLTTTVAALAMSRPNISKYIGSAV